MLQHFGARRWIARIMISWGVISTSTAFVGGLLGFSVARFLLGMAEAGFTPGVDLFFTYWFPGAWRARATAAFLVGIPVAKCWARPRRAGCSPSMAPSGCTTGSGSSSSRACRRCCSG